MSSQPPQRQEGSKRGAHWQWAADRAAVAQASDEG